MPISQTAVGWLLLAAAALTFAGGFAFRAFIGSRREAEPVRRVVRTLRKTRLSRALFGPIEGDVLHDDELDSMILMPAIVIACGLCLTAVFLLGYQTLT
jgi:hypothetical protein